MLLTDLTHPRSRGWSHGISAMRHLNPECIAMLLTSFPEMDVAAQAILRQADEFY